MAVWQDADEAASMDAAEAGLSGASSSGVTAVSFSGLYEALGRRLVNERTVLLLYDTLQTCPHFQNYVFVRRRVMTLPAAMLASCRSPCTAQAAPPHVLTASLKSSS